MMFKTPQFIDVEDKIFGPFTFKQFVYLAGGGGLGYLAYKLIPVKIIGGVFLFAFVGLGFALAFIKPNGKPFIIYLLSMIKYYITPKTYVWKKEEQKKKIVQEENK